ncbi:radical SAM protein [Megasphaera cerevisiae DSM 20462]|jgi:7-carboxy-7-deazaguanine synthase|uniref:7-carboxy-7-deazaguanine synthase n=1 Tax=Megasphaera cerevisiae DSM 20462 TaxID=1122219 RepID=A0A0J6WZX5_9FIRM|nr:radical SAM protein [Megasphaera cerevisiae]KMO87823.1 radical SAM protein [Megasphaera cerevisiae DSM 20462]SJZ50345.1 7-carboxy-7-deazaguanine synthase [Megasphaera cerevisiae DSM 20462]
MKNSLWVNEIFDSIDGEGKTAGQLASFIRLKGCNLRCAYCDTTYAFHEGYLMEAETIASKVSYPDITITGGEPLCQDLHGLLELLQDHSINIETNGSMDITPYFRYAGVWFTIDYKSLSSGMSNHMLLHNFRCLRPQDVLKFVVGTKDDLEQARFVCDTYRPGCPVYVGAVFGAISPGEIVEFMKEYELTDWHLQLQLHKFIWAPEARGV